MWRLALVQHQLVHVERMMMMMMMMMSMPLMLLVLLRLQQTLLLQTGPEQGHSA
jgi:hypothetical protein